MAPSFVITAMQLSTRNCNAKKIGDASINYNKNINGNGQQHDKILVLSWPCVPICDKIMFQVARASEPNT